MEDDCDIIIIGAGIAGTACALRCARAGLSVLLLERAEIPGSKNLSGGRLYTHALAELLPQFHLTAPLNDASLTKAFPVNAGLRNDVFQLTARR